METICAALFMKQMTLQPLYFVSTRIMLATDSLLLGYWIVFGFGGRYKFCLFLTLGRLIFMFQIVLCPLICICSMRNDMALMTALYNLFQFIVNKVQIHHIYCSSGIYITLKMGKVVQNKILMGLKIW